MILQDLTALDGKLELYAWDGQFLGLLSSDLNDANSIINLRTYGNAQNINSIHYKHGIYGGQYGRYSPYNYRCSYPPSIVFQRQCIGIVSKNKYITDLRSRYHRSQSTTCYLCQFVRTRSRSRASACAEPSLREAPPSAVVISTSTSKLVAI